jgi:23S rRNA (cytidine1920-2'-O)/16S rRNA (cytidine1409-2'-O)-methyltransferase
MARRTSRLDIVLVELGLAPSRERARALILAAQVRVDGRVVSKAGAPVARDARVELAAPDHPYVGRGGIKLAHALDAFGVAPAGRRALDIGASTGGFTDVLLVRGALRVVAVDVGHGQLAARLATHHRVRSLEGLDARALTRAHVGEAPGAIVCDVSFISQRLVLPHMLPLAAPQAWLVSLIKPQFEVGPTDIVKGRVRSEAALERACADVRACIEAQGWGILGLIPSPILGGGGAKEFLIAARRD